VSDVELVPEMLQFDFQIIHPTAQISVYSQTSIVPECLSNQQSKSLVFNKLLCNSTSVPLNSGIVSFKWRFFEHIELAALSQAEQLSMIPLVNKLQQLQLGNLIQEPVNFA
jgi:hypothetical protein